MMDVIGHLFLAQISIVFPGELVEAGLLPATGLSSLPAMCLACSLNISSDFVNYGVEILDLMGEPLEMEATSIGAGLSTPLEAGMQAFEDALALQKWGP